MPSSVHWRQPESSNSTASSSRSDSNRSYDTAPTEGSYHTPRPQTDDTYMQGCGYDYFVPTHDYFVPTHNLDCPASYTARSSVETYASTSEEDITYHLDPLPEYHVPDLVRAPRPVDAIPTTPRDFADLFPTWNRLSIRHDDATLDGNMNLRVDAQVEDRHHKKQNYTLFHLRMHDLRTRHFSLRRYCRESGREVCHSMRKYHTSSSSSKPPVLQRASTALASLRHKPDSRPSTAAGLKRSDSGYGSMREWEAGMDLRPKSAGFDNGRALMPTNTLKLEFSNYAHIHIKRRGARSNKRYAFEYWGHDYSWKRIIHSQGHQETVSYYLIRGDDEKKPLAHICPVRLTRDQADQETARGGWIPPCYMRITDDNILNANCDLADVVVATGLMALVDDSIKRRFHSKQSPQLHIPLVRNASFKLNMEYIGPKRLIDEVFHRNKSNALPSRRIPTSRQASVEP